MSSATRLWKKRSGEVEQHSGAAEKVFSFRPEPCSPSSRNGVQNQPGTPFSFIAESCSASPGFPKQLVARNKGLLDREPNKRRSTPGWVMNWLVNDARFQVGAGDQGLRLRRASGKESLLQLFAGKESV
jgi:hypothetical protein